MAHERPYYCTKCDTQSKAATFQTLAEIPSSFTDDCSTCGEQTVFRRYFEQRTWRGAAYVKGSQVPNGTKDMAGYREWQTEAFARVKDRIHPDNIGRSDVTNGRTIRRTESGKSR